MSTATSSRRTRRSNTSGRDPRDPPPIRCTLGPMKRRALLQTLAAALPVALVGSHVSAAPQWREDIEDLRTGDKLLVLFSRLPSTHGLAWFFDGSGPHAEKLAADRVRDGHEFKWVELDVLRVERDPRYRYTTVDLDMRDAPQIEGDGLRVLRFCFASRKIRYRRP